MSRIDDIIDGVIGREGHYSNHPSDRGGETMWGITIGKARERGYAGPMNQMPRSVAKLIYEQDYVKPFEGVLLISPEIAEELIDTGVNMGVAIAALFLQQMLNGLNANQRYYKDIQEDGSVGEVTLRALRSYCTARGAEGVHVMLLGLNCLQGARYINLARRRSKNEDFLYGWLRTRVDL